MSGNIRRKIKAKIRMTAALATVMVFVSGFCLTAYAAVDDASLDFDEAGSITVTLTSDEEGSVVTDGELTLYQVADLYLDDGNMAYAYTDDFAGCGISLDDISEDSYTAMAADFSEYVEANNIEGTALAISSDGTVTFSGLTLGLYLVMQTTASEGYYAVTPFMVTVPLAGEDAWIYNVNASPKTEILTPVPAEPGDSTNPENPANPDTGDEPGNPSGTDTEGTITVTNPSTPTGSGSTLPQTGQLVWPIPLLAAAGALLYIVGACLRKRAAART